MTEVASGVTGLTGNLQTMLTGFGAKLQEWVDKVFPPEKREKLLDTISAFASDKPLLSSFIGSHIAISGPVIGLFLVLTISVAIFAILAGIILGLLGAVLFIVTAIGFALVILLPTLFFTIGVATFLWLWGWGVYKILQYFNEKPIPGIHKPLGQGLAEETGLDGLLGYSNDGAEETSKEGNDGEQQGAAQRKQVMNGKAENGKAENGKAEHSSKSGSQGRSGSGGNSSHNQKENDHKGSGKSSGADSTGGAGNATKKVGDAGKGAHGKVTGAAGNVTGAASSATNAIG